MQLITFTMLNVFNRICTYVFSSPGYANEVGEAFRALVPVSLVWGTYAVATAYVTADAVDKGKKAAVVRIYICMKRALMTCACTVLSS